MSCPSLRSLHNICIANCSTNVCPCKPNQAFSFQPLKACKELYDNATFTHAQITNILCEEIANRLVGCEGPFQTNLEFLDCIGLTNWPIFSCPAELRLIRPNNIFVIGTIIGGVVIPNSEIIIPDAQYAVQINGSTCSNETIEFSSLAQFCTLIRANNGSAIIGIDTNDVIANGLAPILWPTSPSIDISIFGTSVDQIFASVVNGILSPVGPNFSTPGTYSLQINGVPCDPEIEIELAP